MNGLIKLVQMIETNGINLGVNKVILGLLRHFMTLAGGFFINQGIMDKNDAETAIAAIITLIGVAWSVLLKVSAQRTAAQDTIPVPSILIIFGTASLLLCSGCATTANDVAMARIAADTANAYYNQPNNADYMILEGTNIEWRITGATRVVFSGPIPTKSIYPREEGTLKQVVDGVSELGKTAALGIVGYQGVKALKAQKPTVVTTERLVPVQGAVQ